MANLLKNFDNSTIDVKMSYYLEYDIWIVQHFFAQPNVS